MDHDNDLNMKTLYTFVSTHPCPTARFIARQLFLSMVIAKYRIGCPHTAKPLPPLIEFIWVRDAPLQAALKDLLGSVPIEPASSDLPFVGSENSR